MTADASSDGLGNATIPFSPAFNAMGSAQNITALPAANAVITVYGASGPDYQTIPLHFHKQAFTFACAYSAGRPYGGTHGRAASQYERETRSRL